MENPGAVYNSTVVRIILVFIVYATYHHSSEKLTLLSPDNHDNNNHTTPSSQPFVPSWELDPTAQPYMGNLTCIFEATHWDLGSQKYNYSATDLEKRHNCGKIKYRPYRDWVAPDPNVVFEKLPHGATIYIVGDSIGTQQSIDMLCYMASVSRLVRIDFNEEKAAVARCHRDNECEVDGRGEHTGLDLSGATFRSYKGNTTKDIHVRRGDGNIGIYAERKARVRIAVLMGQGKKDDIYVINNGLHYGTNVGKLISDLNNVKPDLVAAKDRGARVLWRETNAAHFNGTNGYYSADLKGDQDRREAKCVSHKWINAEASRNYLNGEVTPLMKSWGIHVLETWESSYLMPEWCHVGMGVDCAHLLQPGGISYWTEALLKYIEEKM